MGPDDDEAGDRRPETGPGLIVRLDEYTLSVDGVNYRATPEQEERIRSLTPEQRDRFHEVMGNQAPKPLWVEVPRAPGLAVKEVENTRTGVHLRRVERSTNQYRCSYPDCANPIIPVGSPYVRARKGNNAAKYHPACAAGIYREGVPLLFPTGVPLTEVPPQAALHFDPAPARGNGNQNHIIIEHANIGVATPAMAEEHIRRNAVVNLWFQ